MKVIVKEKLTIKRLSSIVVMLMSGLFFVFSMPSGVSAACCQIEGINEDPIKDDYEIIKKFYGKESILTGFKVKHVNRSLVLIKKMSTENKNEEYHEILIYYNNGLKNVSIMHYLSGKFYYPDLIPDTCEECVWLRFGSITVREADFLVTKNDVVFSAAESSLPKAQK